MAIIFRLPPPPVNENMNSPAWSDWFYKLQNYVQNNTGSQSSAPIYAFAAAHG